MISTILQIMQGHKNGAKLFAKKRWAKLAFLFGLWKIYLGGAVQVRIAQHRPATGRKKAVDG
jgi:hypothetical protein